MATQTRVFPNDPQSGNLKEVYTFPNDIENIDHWMVFRVNKHQLLRKDDYPIQRDQARIFLPVPPNLATQYGQNYDGSRGIGLAGAAGSRSNVTSVEGAVSSLVEEVKSGFMDPSQYTGAAAYYALQAAEENVTPLVTGAAAAAFGTGPLGTIAAATLGAAAGQWLEGAVAGKGVARNPYMAVIYQSPNMRQHTFEWKFLPRSESESIALRDIIYAFKYHSAPGMTDFGEHFFQYPEQFDIDFHHFEYLYNIGPSVLTDMQVNYHGEGRAMYYSLSDDPKNPNLPNIKAPASVGLSLTFQEVSIQDKASIERNNR